MSTSITIPVRTTYGESCKAAPSSSSSSSYSISPRTPQQPQPQPQASSPSSKNSKYGHDRRPSLLSSSLSKEEVIVVDIGDPDGVKRLITCIKSSQGYEWNPEIFFPSYVEHNYELSERKREEPVDIRLTEEEIKNMFPQ